MVRIGDLCRKSSNLKAAEIILLEELGKVFPLVSDIAHAKGTLFVKEKSGDHFLTLTESFPQTSYVQSGEEKVGRVFDRFEEPLVELTFQSGKPQSGKRQWNITEEENELRSWPIYLRSGSEPEAVLLFEWSAGLAEKEQIGFLSEIAFEFFTGSVFQEEGSTRRISSYDGILLLNVEGKIIWASETASQLYRPLGVGHLVGRWNYEKVLGLKGFSKSLQSQRVIDMVETINNHIWNFCYLPISLKNKDSKVLVILTDKTEILTKEKEIRIKETLIQEMHHRIKNNLQTIAGLLRMQARRSKSEETKRALQESMQRIFSMAAVHDFLAYKIDEKITLLELVNNLISMNQKINSGSNDLFEVVTEKLISLTPDEASTLSLVLNELIQNALEHGQGEKITISWIEEDSKRIILRVMNPIHDDRKVDFNQENRLGLQIVKTLVQETLGGEFYICQKEESVIGEVSFFRNEATK